MNYKWKNICIVDTIYSLFLYLLISNEIDIKRTYFYWSEGIPLEIREKFKGQSYTFFNKFKSGTHRKLYQFILYQFGAIIKWPFLKNKDLTYWGHSHLFFSSGIIRNNKMNLIEDGLMNYNKQMVPFKYLRFKRIKKIIWGPFSLKEEYIGERNFYGRIILTKNEYPKCLNKNIISVINMKNMWVMSDENKRKMINEIFNVTLNDIKVINKSSEILLTQCFSEDSYMKEEEKIRMYRELINKYCNKKSLLIKPHPREKTMYEKIFPDIPVFSKKIPAELLELNGLNLKAIYTINSTAAYNFSNSEKIIILGNEFMDKFIN